MLQSILASPLSLPLVLVKPGTNDLGSVALRVPLFTGRRLGKLEEGEQSGLRPAILRLSAVRLAEATLLQASIRLLPGLFVVNPHPAEPPAHVTGVVML